jgi:hypothetical protein
MRTVNGGFVCYCGTTYKGEYTSVTACANETVESALAQQLQPPILLQHQHHLHQY